MNAPNVSSEMKAWLTGVSGYGGGFVRAFADVVRRADNEELLAALRKDLERGPRLKNHPKFTLTRV